MPLPARMNPSERRRALFLCEQQKADGGISGDRWNQRERTRGAGQLLPGKDLAMAIGLLRSLLRAREPSRRRASRFGSGASSGRRLSLESLENRSLPSTVVIAPPLDNGLSQPVTSSAEKVGLLNDSGDHQGDGQSGQGNGQDGGSQDGQSGSSLTPIDVVVETLLDIETEPLSLHTTDYGQGNNPPGLGDTGQPSVLTTGQGGQDSGLGDGQSGSTGSGDNHQDNGPAGTQGNNASDPSVNQGDGQNSPRDNGQGSSVLNAPATGGNSPAEQTGHGAGAAVDPRGGRQDGESNPTKRSRSDGQGWHPHSLAASG